MKLSLRQRFQNAVSAFRQDALQPVGNALSSLTRALSDWFSGAWQQASDPPDADDVRTALNVAVVYDCVRRIATDIAKMSPGIRRLTDSGVWKRDKHQLLSRLLRRPNHFQTWFQFVVSWVCSRLLSGNAYVLKLYGAQGNVLELIVLDPTKVTVLVAEDTGRVFYSVGHEALARVDGDMVVSDDDLIHDRYLPLGHPLVGTAPLERAITASRARHGILANAADLNEHASVPPGILTTPEGLSEAELKNLADKWRTIPKGRIAVIDAAYKFEALSAKYVDSQSQEIGDLSGVDICIAFGMPPWKLGLGTRPVGEPEALQIIYLQDCLQWQVEEIEQALDHGLGVPEDVYLELDPSCLLKMDSKTKAAVAKELGSAGMLSPDEGRAWFDLEPVPGGHTPYLQQQNYSLDALDKRDTAAPAPSSSAPTPGGGSSGPVPETGSGAEDDPAPEDRTRPPLLPWAGVWNASGEYPLGSFATHKGSLWARVERFGPGSPDVLGTPWAAEPASHDHGAEIGAEPGTEAGRPYWALSVKRGEVPTENT